MPTLHWIGKDKVVNHHQDVPFRVMEHKYGFAEGKESKKETSSGNKIIHGDNLEALKTLLPEYEGRIKCIYIDPPYNTGNENWVYNDNVNDPRIKKWLGEVVGKEGEDLSRHDKWLCMMYPRLKLLHKLLADDGAIFISIDDNEKFYLKLICDEIFGSKNFIADIAVINNFKGRSDDKYIATAHEGLIIYQKGYFITNGVALPEEYELEYKLHDEKGRYRLQGLRKRGSGSKREDRPNMFYPFYYNEEHNVLSLETTSKNDTAIMPRLSDGSDGRWRWGIDTAKERINELIVEKVKGRNEYDVFQKDYLPDDGSKRIKPKSVWLGSEFSAESGTLETKKIIGKDVFSTPKPTRIIEYCIEQAADKNSIILDSFAGSGTTAHAVLNLNREDGGNRKFILIEMEDYAETITAERVKRVMNGYGDVPGTGGSFDYYTLGEPLFDEDKNINEKLPVEKIRQYVYYTETGSPLPTEKHKDNEYFLSMHEGAAYYFFYKKGEATALDYDFLATIKTKADLYVIYADNCLLPDSFMKEKNIIFKKIPRDIARV